LLTHPPALSLLSVAAAIRAAFPQQQLVVFNGDLDVQQTIALFQRARVILGPHGAGLSHTLFAAPGTTGKARALAALLLRWRSLPLLPCHLQLCGDTPQLCTGHLLAHQPSCPPACLPCHALPVPLCSD
jgi:hypothetical protein